MPRPSHSSFRFRNTGQLNGWVGVVGRVSFALFESPGWRMKRLECSPRNERVICPSAPPLFIFQPFSLLSTHPTIRNLKFQTCCCPFSTSIFFFLFFFLHFWLPFIYPLHSNFSTYNFSSVSLVVLFLPFFFFLWFFFFNLRPILFVSPLIFYPFPHFLSCAILTFSLHG